MNLARFSRLLAVVSPFLAFACSASTVADAPEPGIPPRAAPSPETSADASADAPDARNAGILTPNETAGSRLRPLYQQLTGADGSVRLDLRAWYDTERDEACTFQKTSDGKTRCTPYGEELALTRDTYFQDAGCSMPVIAFRPYTGPWGDRCHDPSPFTKRYVRIGSVDACTPAKLAAFPKTGRLAVTTVYKKSSNGTCTAFPLGSEPYEVFAAPAPLEEIEPSAFVAVNVADDTPATGKRLRVSRALRTGADGSTSIGAERIVDGERNELCWNQIDQNGEERCMPYGGHLYAGEGFANTSCTQTTWGVANNAGCDDDGRYTFDRYMVRVDYDACRRTEIFPRFTTPPLSRLYYGSAASCTSTSVPTDDTAGYFYFASQPLPPAIAPSAFARIERFERDAPPLYYGKSGTRLTLRQIGQRTPDGFESTTYLQQFDRELGTSCAPTMLQDGKTYCVGSYRHFTFEPSSGVFADPACTDAVVGVSKINPSCDADQSVASARFFAATPYAQGGCQTIRLYAPKTQLAVATLYARNPSGTCAPSYHVASKYDVYRASDLTEVPPSTFVELTPARVK